MRKIQVSKKYDGKALSKFVLDAFPRLSQNQFYKALRKRDIRINNVKVSENLIVHEGDIIMIFIVDSLLDGGIYYEIQTIYEDDNILIVNKPAELSVTDEDEDSEQETLTDLLSEDYSYIEPCHRLDRNTQGLVMFAKNEESLHIILDKFKNREIEKHYKALVYGRPRKRHEIINAYLFKDSKKAQVYISNEPKEGYVSIKTEYSVISINDDTALLDVILHTGRTHQIRAQLASIGLPIIGDGKYGKNEINKKFGKKYQQLIAYKLIFNFKSDGDLLDYLNGKVIEI